MDNTHTPGDETCQCRVCVATAHDESVVGLGSFQQVVALAVQLRHQNDLGRLIYEQADGHRRALLQILGPLATEYHRLGGTIHDGGHTQPIGGCRHNVCATVREGMLSIGQNREQTTTQNGRRAGKD